MTRRIFTLLLAAFALLGCAEPPYTNVDNERLKVLMAEGVPVYDIRRPEEWRETGIVEGSRPLTFFDASGRPRSEFLPRFTAEIGKNDPVVLICRTGNRTDALARYLVEQQGYTQCAEINR